MSAEDKFKPTAGYIAVLETIYKAMLPHQQRAFCSAIDRIRDGQAFEAAWAEAFVELGWSLAAARRQVQECRNQRSDWRTSLN